MQNRSTVNLRIGEMVPERETSRSFFIKYYSIAFSILPGIAGGLALELIFKM